MTNFCLKKQKLTELENKIPDVSNLATNTALTAVENKIPSVSSLVKKTNYDKKLVSLSKACCYFLKSLISKTCTKVG